MILNSERAVTASKWIIQAFVRLRRVLNANRDLARRIDDLNARFEKKTGEDAVRFHAIFHRFYP
jgi:superfamily II helicase